MHLHLRLGGAFARFYKHDTPLHVVNPRFAHHFLPFSTTCYTLWFAPNFCSI